MRRNLFLNRKFDIEKAKRFFYASLENNLILSD